MSDQIVTMHIRRDTDPPRSSRHASVIRLLDIIWPHSRTAYRDCTAYRHPGVACYEHPTAVAEGSCGCVQAGKLPDGYDINYVLFGLTGEEAREKMLHGKVWDE